MRLDAVAAVLLDGLWYRRAARMVGSCKTEVGDSLDLLLGELAALGFCQPDGRFVVTLHDLRELLAEMATSGEAVCWSVAPPRPYLKRASRTPSLNWRAPAAHT